MRTEPVRADADWLALREPADAAARSTELVDLLRPRLPQRDLVIHDLGSGTGSMARWLAPQLTQRQHWVLHDRDAELLGRARALAPPQTRDGSVVTIETREDDITRLTPAELADADLITASALLDMMTAGELDRFVDVCTSADCAVLITLTVVGRVELWPSDPLDHEVMKAFNDHQRRDNGGGALLGPDAATAAARTFAGSGRTVFDHPSPWRLGPDTAAMAAAWFTGWLAAAQEQDISLKETTDAYRGRREEELASRQLTATVHHEDLLAVPRSSYRWLEGRGWNRTPKPARGLVS